MNKYELMTALKGMKAQLKQIAGATSIPVGTLHKFMHGKKELEVLEMDRVVEWVKGRGAPELSNITLTEVVDGQSGEKHVFTNEVRAVDNRFYRESEVWVEKPWIKKIEDFCYENKITPEDLIIGYVPPFVRPIPRTRG